jgi:hypothetical protein
MCTWDGSSALLISRLGRLITPLLHCPAADAALAGSPGGFLVARLARDELKMTPGSTPIELLNGTAEFPATVGLATGVPVRNPQEHAQPRQLHQHLAHSIAVPLRRGNGFLFREFVICPPTLTTGKDGLKARGSAPVSSQLAFCWKSLNHRNARVTARGKTRIGTPASKRRTMHTSTK